MVVGYRCDNIMVKIHLLQTWAHCATWQDQVSWRQLSPTCENNDDKYQNLILGYWTGFTDICDKGNAGLWDPWWISKRRTQEKSAKHVVLDLFSVFQAQIICLCKWCKFRGQVLRQVLTESVAPVAKVDQHQEHSWGWKWSLCSRCGSGTEDDN